jgi:hypothetical protein
MDIGHALGRRLGAGGAIAAGVALASAGIALASNAVKDGSYIGHYKGGMTEAISFQVSANGKRVVDLDAQTPFKCSGGCGGVPSVTGGSAKISKKGTFELKVKLVGPGSTKSFGTDTITGTFQSHGRAKGKISSHFTTGSFGSSATWTATGSVTG